MNKIIGLAILLVFGFFIFQYPRKMINPGELVNGHQEIKDKCLACHTLFNGIANEKCISCHALSDIPKVRTPHSEESKAKSSLQFHEKISRITCIKCHTDHKGSLASVSISSFRHELLPETIISNCIDCHEKPTDRIHNRFNASCNTCHLTKSWKSNSTFNHDMIQEPDKTNCILCHNVPTDSYHSQVGKDCIKCHSTNKWIPSTFDHSAFFILDENHNAQCKTCHINNDYGNYSCYNCHEHSQNKILEEHSEHGIADIEKCASCHRSGNEHDIRQPGDLQNNGPHKTNRENSKHHSKEEDHMEDHDD
jgi:hypothetical protein